MSGSPTEVVIGGSALLPRYPVFRTPDMDQAHAHLRHILGEHSVDYLPHERRLDFRHRLATVGSIAVNSLEWGAGVTIKADLADYYVLKFTLVGECELWRKTNHTVVSTGSVAVLNSRQAFTKALMPRTRQLLLCLDRRLVEREFRAWTGLDAAEGIEFDLSPIEMAKLGTLTRFVAMLCDDLRNDSSDLLHPLVADRVASGLVSLMLTSIPHNKTRAIETAADRLITPFFVRRVEQFIEERARDDITLTDLTGIAGVSTRALQAGFRRFRDTTPMAHLRSIRLELARAELMNAAQQSSSVAAAANATGFGHLGRFARDYQTRFGELPSQTLDRARLTGPRTRQSK